MKKFILSIIITAILLALLLSQVSVQEILSSFKSFNITSLLLAFFFYMLLYLARAVRFSQFMPKKTSLWHLFKISAAHNFLTRAIPMKLGELSFAELINSRYKMPRSYGLGALLMIRILDLSTLVFLATVSLLSIQFGGTRTWGLLTISIITLIILIYKIDTMINIIFTIIENAFKKMRINQERIDKLKEIKTDLSKPMSMIKDPKFFIIAFSSSIICWSFGFTVFYILSRAAGLDVPVNIFIPGAALAFFANTLPISVVGDLGVHESGWTIGFMILGVKKQIAIVTGLSVHLVVLGFMIVVFLLFGAQEIYSYLKNRD